MAKPMDQAFFASVSAQTVRAALRHAQDTVWNCDRELLLNDASERTLCGRFAFYLIDRFPRFDVDLEYNRNHEEEDYLKRIYDSKVAEAILTARRARNLAERLADIDEEGLIVWPDIIVHTRDYPFNLLVIEAKKSSSAVSPAIDLQKLGAIKEAMGYRFAAFVYFPTGAHAKQADANETDWFALR